MFIKGNTISDHILAHEYRLAKLQFVQSNFTDAKVYKNYDPHIKWKVVNVEFTSKLVNKNYTDVIFTTKRNALYVSPIHKLHFEYKIGDNVTSEDIIIGSTPTSSRLAYIKWSMRDQKVAFSRFVYNMTKNKFDEAIFNKCRTEVCKFIASNSNYKLDEKNMDPRIKALISFA